MAEESNNTYTSNNQNNEPPSSSDIKRTIGEELWEVHLHRREGLLDDTALVGIEAVSELEQEDAKRSIGEELWQVHLRRSQGVEPDIDQDITTLDNSNDDDKGDEQVIQLRNRTVSIQSH